MRSAICPVSNVLKAEITLDAKLANRVREDAEFAVYSRPGDDFQSLIMAGREVAARERRHPDPGKRTLCRDLQPKVFIGRASLRGRHIAPVPLQNFSEREPLRDAPIDDGRHVNASSSSGFGPLSVRASDERVGRYGSRFRRPSLEGLRVRMRESLRLAQSPTGPRSTRTSDRDRCPYFNCSLSSSEA